MCNPGPFPQQQPSLDNPTRYRAIRARLMALESRRASEGNLDVWVPLADLMRGASYLLYLHLAPLVGGSDADESLNTEYARMFDFLRTENKPFTGEAQAVFDTTIALLDAILDRVESAA